MVIEMSKLDKRLMVLKCTPIKMLNNALSEGIQETVTLSGRGLRGIDQLLMEWECLNLVITTNN
jgi:hypothetical protein